MVELNSICHFLHLLQSLYLYFVSLFLSDRICELWALILRITDPYYNNTLSVLESHWENCERPGWVVTFKALAGARPCDTHTGVELYLSQGTLCTTRSPGGHMDSMEWSDGQHQALTVTGPHNDSYLTICASLLICQLIKTPSRTKQGPPLLISSCSPSYHQSSRFHLTVISLTK